MVASVETIELDDLLKESIEQLMVVADKRGIDIGFNGTAHYRLHASRSDLRSLFDNLIGNAMLHTPEGSRWMCCCIASVIIRWWILSITAPACRSRLSSAPSIALPARRMSGAGQRLRIIDRAQRGAKASDAGGAVELP